MKTTLGMVFVLALVGCGTVQEDAGRPLKVLAVGNSFSFSLIHEWPQVAKAAGRPLDFVSLHIGGCTFETHVAKLSATNCPYGIAWDYQGDRTLAALPFQAKVKPVYDKKGEQIKYYAANSRDVLAGDDWDVITVQQGSPQSWRWGSYRYADELIAAIRELAPRAEIRVQQTWSYCTGDWRVRNPFTGGPGRWGVDLARMYDRLTMNYARLAAANGFKVIPTGVAVQDYRRLAGLTGYEGDVVGELHRTDKTWTGTDGDPIHLNKSGHYLQALVWTGALFGVDPRTVAYRPDYLDAAKAEMLREAAAQALATGLPPPADPLAGQTYCANADWLHRFAAAHGMRRVEPSADRIDTLLILVDGHVPTEKEALAAYVEDLCRKHPNAELVFVSASRDVERVVGRYDVRFFRLPPDLPDDDLVTAFERWY